jgi:aminomuconate-semialdehyde/2-hydroxymuconate-6-semialdehyde dehydrogenase
MQKVLNYIGGELVAPSSQAWFDKPDPSTGEPSVQVPDSDEKDIQRAVEAARNAFPAWAATPAAERARLLRRVADTLRTRLDAFARAEAIDTGKPLKLASTVDIPRSIHNFEFFADAVTQFSTEAHVMDGGAINYTLRSPLGVVGCISPWNLPLYLLTWKIAPALATGNTVVAKPSELTPLTASMLAELSVEAGLPAGVLNVVHGRGPTAGAALVAHPDVPAISFTGGTATGAAIAASAAPRFKALSLELGGKNPTLVFDDVDLDAILPDLVRSSFWNQGQICLCGSRLLVQRSIHDRFVERFVAAVEALRLGDPADPETDQGALISEAHRDKVERYLELARSLGGVILTGGDRPTDLPERVRDGAFVHPTVIAGLPPDCAVNQEEIFGPVVTILPFDDEAEALAIANGTPYGLAASVWTNDLRRAHRVAGRLDAGTVWVNTWLQRDLRVPFGGMKQSGVGREGGTEALHFFTEPTNVSVAL